MRRILKKEKFSKIISALNARQALRILESVETSLSRKRNYLKRKI